MINDDTTQQLVILVGGRGSRLGTIAQSTPKPLMPITEDKLFLDFLLETYVRQGFNDIVLLAGHLGDQVIARYDNVEMGRARVSVIIEEVPLGTGGALKSASERLAPTFVVTNGDTLFDINVRRLDARLREDESLSAVLALREVENPSRFGTVVLEPNGSISEFLEKKPSSIDQAGLINGGTYVLRKAALDSLPDGISSIETDLFPKLAKAGRLAGVKSSGYFLDIGLPETLEQARDELPRRRRPVLFLDRDGVVNVDKVHLYRQDDFEWIEGVIDLIRYRNDLGHAVIVVTNQAGVAKGKYTEEDVLQLHEFIQDQLHSKGAFIDAFYYCPYHSDALVPRYQAVDHPDRKPNPGMLLKAFQDFPLDRDNAILIGDQMTDLQAAQAVGLRGYLFTGGNIFDFANGLV